MKTFQLTTIVRQFFLFLLIALFPFQNLRTQSLNNTYDNNRDGVSDDYPHNSLNRNGNIYLSPKDTGDVVHYISTPDFNCQGLTWDGGYLWCSDVISVLIYKIDPDDGTVVNSFSSPGTFIEGMTWDGTNLWGMDNNGGSGEQDMLYKIDPDNGSVITSIELTGLLWPHGLAWDGQNIWINDFSTHLINKIDTATGNVLQTINAPGMNCIGLTWDGYHLWTDDFMTNKLYCIDPADGTLIYTVNSPEPNARDLAWDGQYLWILAFQANKIFQVDVGFVTGIESHEIISENPVSMTIYPNPVSSELNIEFLLNEKTNVSVGIYNQNGSFVGCITNKSFPPGKHILKWERGFYSNQKLRDGIYYCVLKIGSVMTSRKFILLQ